jgi:hypothetical protein
LPDTVAVPTVVPPEQSLGALDCGPKTLNVIVPDGVDPPASDVDTDEAETAVPAMPDEGAPTEPNDGPALTTVSLIPAPQVEAAGWVLVSPS